MNILLKFPRFGGLRPLLNTITPPPHIHTDTHTQTAPYSCGGVISFSFLLGEKGKIWFGKFFLFTKRGSNLTHNFHVYVKFSDLVTNFPKPLVADRMIQIVIIFFIFMSKFATLLTGPFSAERTCLILFSWFSRVVTTTTTTIWYELSEFKPNSPNFWYKYT